jgi:hypothetical protein
MMRDFLNFPGKIYHSDPNWVPMLFSETRRTLDVNQNPYFRNADLKLLLCYKGSNVLARVAIVINHQHIQKFRRSVFFGYFEAMPDFKAVEHLFSIIFQHCKTHSIDFLEGPLNPNHYSELGLLLKNSDSPPSFFQPYNPEYYHQFLSQLGFHISTQLHTRKNENIKKYLDDRYGPGSYDKQFDGYKIRPFYMSNFKQELEYLRSIFNDAFSENWNFLPLSRDEYLFSAKYLKLITSPELLQIVEHKDEPVGAIQCVLDINPLIKKMHGKTGPFKYLQFLKNKKNIKSLIIFAIGIKKAYHHTPVFEIIFRKMVEIARNYQVLETSWMMDHNVAAVKASQRLGLTPDKHFAIYEKKILQ